MNPTLWHIRNIFSKRHDGYVFDAWDNKYPTFKASRREMLKMYIFSYRKSKR